MRMFEIPGIIGMGLVLAVLGACGGGGPDSTGDAQGAATGVPTGSASGTAAAASASTAPPASAPKSSASPTGAAPGGTPRPTPTTPPDPNGGKGGNGLPVPTLPDGLPGLPGNIGDGNDCCFNGKYFHCPNAAACFGGFDVEACIQKCGADVDCIEQCTSQLDDTGAPQGCDANAAPPPGFDCAP